MEMIKIHNCETGEVIEREMTKEELAQLAEQKKIAETFKAEENAKIAKRAELLEKLGITEEEAKLLLG